MMLCQVDIPSWLNYGGLGLAGLILAIGIPWLLKHQREKDAIHQGAVDKLNETHKETVANMNKAHQESIKAITDSHKDTIERITTKHTLRVQALIQDNKDERAANNAALDKMCATFKTASDAEKELCERRIGDLKEVYQEQIAEIKQDIKDLQQKGKEET